MGIKVVDWTKEAEIEGKRGFAVDGREVGAAGLMDYGNVPEMQLVN